MLPSGANGDLEIDPSLCDRLLLDLESRKIQIRCISGAWSPAFTDLIPNLTPDLTFPTKTIVLASETIYLPATLPLFTDTLLSLLRVSSTSGSPALGLLAAKSVYFGVGGGVDEFLQILEKRRGEATVVWESQEVGVRRTILEVGIES